MSVLRSGSDRRSSDLSKAEPSDLSSMATRDIIVVGASAGGVEAVVQVVGALPADLPAAVFVVIHTSPVGSGLLPKILNRVGKLRAEYATNRRKIEHGKIYVAPPDHHLMVHDGVMQI